MKGGECYKGRSCARYFIAGHGCYLPEYKINIDPKITLDFFSYENECLQYNNSYIETFCSQSQYKRVKGYTPEFSLKNKYYQMVFNGEKTEGYKYISVYCCNTDSYVYKFYDDDTGIVNQDLTLSHVLDLITLHNDTHLKLKKVNLSILTCNNSCYKDLNNNTFSVKLNKTKHGALTLRQGRNSRRLNTFTLLKESRAATKGRRRIINYLPEMPPLRHRFKDGDRVLIKTWETLPAMDKLFYKVQYKKTPLLLEIKEEPTAEVRDTKLKIKDIKTKINEEQLYYYSPIFIGDHVMFNKELYVVLNEAITQVNVINTIQNINTGDIVEVAHEELIKCFF